MCTLLVILNGQCRLEKTLCKQYELFFVCFFLHQVMNFVAIPMSLMYYLDFNHSATAIHTFIARAIMQHKKNNTWYMVYMVVMRMVSRENNRFQSPFRVFNLWFHLHMHLY